MKKQNYVLIISTFLFIILQSSGCKKDETPVSTIIGANGPSGGIVFYDKGYYSDGWRYLEAAPNDLPGLYKFGCIMPTFSEIELSHEIGSGKSNTLNIVNEQNNAFVSSSTNCDISQLMTAPKACDAYSLNGFNDWFLPSHYEFKLMAQTIGLERGNIGNFYLNSYYWASSKHMPLGWSNLYRISRPMAAWGNGDVPQNWSDWTTEDVQEQLKVRPIRAY